MIGNRKEHNRQPKRPGAQNPIPNCPPELQVAINHFLEWNDQEEVKRRLFTLLHCAFESTTADNWDSHERSNLFFTVRELGVIVDALFGHYERQVIKN